MASFCESLLRYMLTIQRIFAINIAVHETNQQLQGAFMMASNQNNGDAFYLEVARDFLDGVSRMFMAFGLSLLAFPITIRAMAAVYYLILNATK